MRRTHDVLSLHEAPPDLLELICIGMAREVGSVNDQLTRYVWDYERERTCELGELSARAEMLGGSFAVVVSSDGTRPLGSTVSGLRQLVNPRQSRVRGAGFERLVFFPSSIARIARLAGTDLVFVPAWAKEQVLRPEGAFNEPYGHDLKRREAWSKLPEEVLFCCALLSQRKMPLITTHDLVGHIAGMDGSRWPALQNMALRVERSLEAYFAHLGPARVETLLLPFLAGTLLDVFAQPMSRPHTRQLGVLIESLTDYLDVHGRRLIECAVKRIEIFPRECAALMDLLTSTEDSTRIRARAMELLDAIARHTTSHHDAAPAISRGEAAIGPITS
jgi:hypothetical protein